MAAGSRAQVTVSTVKVIWFVGARDWRAIAIKMDRDPSRLERTMQRDWMDLELAEELLTFLDRPDAITMLVRCVAKPCPECLTPLIEGRCPECQPALVCAAGCGEHVREPGFCGWCAEERSLVDAAAPFAVAA